MKKLFKVSSFASSSRIAVLVSRGMHVNQTFGRRKGANGAAGAPDGGGAPVSRTVTADSTLITVDSDEYTVDNETL